MNKHPIQEPKPTVSPDPKGPKIDPMPEGPSTSDPVTASKKVDDISRHESHYDPKQAPKPVQEQQPRADDKPGVKPPTARVKL